MRLTKAFALAAFAVVAATAFIGSSSAMAQHQIALCKALETLCAKGNSWPKGTTLLALASIPELVGVLPIKCPDSVAVFTTGAAVANPFPVAGTITFGALPTPNLGAGCTGCPFGFENESLHPATVVGNITVAANDVYSLVVTGSAQFLCSGFLGTVSCKFEGTNLSSPIAHDGSHANHPNASNLALIALNATLKASSENPGICGETAKWIISYVIYLADFEGTSGLVWPALDKA